MARPAIVMCVWWTLSLSIGCSSAGAAVHTAASPVAAPACSTAVASAPDLPDVATSFASVLGSPFGIVITPNSHDAFVASPTGSIIEYSLEDAGARLAQINTFGIPQSHAAPIGGASPVGLALSPHGKYLVAAAGSGAVVVDVERLEKRHSPSTSWTVGTFTSPGAGAIETTLSPNGDYVFVSLEDSNELAVFNLKRALAHGFGPSDLVGMVPLGEAPVGVTVSPNGRSLYVTSELAIGSQSDGTLTTVNLKEAERTPARSIISTVGAGCSPVRVVATRSSVYVTARGSDALLKFSAPDLVTDPSAALEASVPVGEAPVDLALVKGGRLLVIADSDRFGAADEQPNLAVVTVPAHGIPVLDGYVKSGEFPRDMALSPDGKTLTVSNFDSAQLETVEVSTLP